jgi:hypothetical protein
MAGAYRKYSNFKVQPADRVNKLQKITKYGQTQGSGCFSGAEPHGIFNNCAFRSDNPCHVTLVDGANDGIFAWF